MTSPERVLETGVEVFSLWRDWPVNGVVLDRVVESGSGWVRVGVGWCSVEEAGPGVVSEWYVQRLDATVVAAEARGLQVLATLGCTPGWLSGSGSLTVLPPALRVGEVQRVAAWLAGRYAGRIAAWEIWNEPDCSAGTGCGATAPEVYLPVLRAGFTGVRAGDPGAVVVSGGISGVNTGWVEGLYAAGGRGWFDALGVHPYQGPAAEPPEAPPADHPYRISNVERVRAVMVAAGDAAVPVWFTEFGWTTGAGEGWSAGVDEATQADYLGRAIDMVQRQYPYVTHAFVFTIRDRDDWNAYENNFGLTRLDGSPKPALGALRNANDRLDALRQPDDTRVVTLDPVADATAWQASAGRSAGAATTLEVDSRAAGGSSRVTSYLRFPRPDLAPGESVVSAALTVQVTDGTVDGPVIWPTTTVWSESTLSWKRQPTRAATVPLADLGAMAPGPVTLPLMLAGPVGELSLELYAQVDDGLRLVSREDPALDLRPRLTLVVTG
ncbi:DNRLRE domain-containing protein [Geodermatophilus tzadiensis]|uniref:DNRLRE domain-containing protein n=1 Tax=Geodermatophilus tzadiensis TaxID=1137988 RepID=UPI001B800AB8|nr:DNRLRE domain-containing protein [Geodermatophilus tzadiensis]